MAVSENIKKYRLANNLSQEDLAELCNVARCTVTNWECGKRLPNFDSVRMLSKIFNVTMEELIGNGEERNKKEAKDKKKSRVKKILTMFVIILGLLLLKFPINDLCCETDNYILENINSIKEITLQINVQNKYYKHKFFKKNQTEFETDKFLINENDFLQYGFKKYNVAQIKIIVDFGNVDIRNIQDVTRINLNNNKQKHLVIDEFTNDIYIKGTGYFSAYVNFKNNLAYIDVLPV